MIQHMNGREVDEILQTLKSKLSAASGFLECCDRNNTIINLKDEEITVLFWALESFHKEREDRPRKKGLERAKEIVDVEAWAYCEYLVRKYKGGSTEAEAASALASNIRERIDEELEQEGRT